MTVVTGFPQMALRDDFISAMRGVAASVTVVTTEGIAGRHGATVSAFNSLSADPPSVLVCLRSDSRLARAVMKNRRDCVNVLPEDQPELAGRFAVAQDGEINDRFEDIPLAPIPADCPVLTGATAFQCRLEEEVAYGSHVILIGRVTTVSQAGAAPLAWMDGRFHRVHPK